MTATNTTAPNTSAPNTSAPNTSTPNTTTPATPGTSPRSSPGVIRERNDHDAATVIAVVLALSARDVVEADAPSGPRTMWSDPAYRLRNPLPSPTGWWASAMPR